MIAPDMNKLLTTIILPAFLLLVLQLKESGISDEEITNLLEDLAEEVSELNRKRE